MASCFVIRTKTKEFLNVFSSSLILAFHYLFWDTKEYSFGAFFNTKRKQLNIYCIIDFEGWNRKKLKNNHENMAQKISKTTTERKGEKGESKETRSGNYCKLLRRKTRNI